jgi:GH24 family phage-related lysozyme (muramidase)
MYPSVSAAWMEFTNRLEGHLTWMYLDILGYVTTGVGNLVDPIDLARALPWVNPDGSPATDEAVCAAWEAVDKQRSDPKGKKQTTGLATKYGGAFAGVTTIRLTESGVQQLVEHQVALNEAILREHFLHYGTMPADAQMAINSMAWAMGAGFPSTFTAFRAAVNAGDWEAARANANFRGVGVQPRIDANAVMFENAACVAARLFDPTVLHYPNNLAAGLSHAAAVTRRAVSERGH